jgi:cytochrome c-type biogenesis protein CcmH/NrfF
VPYQNPNSEMMFAIAIWFLPIVLFVIMLIATFAAHNSEDKDEAPTALEEVQPRSEYPAQR